VGEGLLRIKEFWVRLVFLSFWGERDGEGRFVDGEGVVGSFGRAALRGREVSRGAGPGLSVESVENKRVLGSFGMVAFGGERQVVLGPEGDLEDGLLIAKEFWVRLAMRYYESR
jgi:hypothetical protein